LSNDPDGVPPARRMSPQQRRDQLVRVALRLYAEQPPELVTIEDVSRAADVSRALFYRYFPNITELRLAALRTVVDEMLAAMDPPAGLGLIEQMRFALSAFLGSAQTYASAYVALLRTGSVVATEESIELVDGVRNHLLRLVSERLDDRTGTDSAATHTAPMLELTMRSWFAVVENASVAWLREGKITRERLENWLIDQLVAMIGTTARHDPATASQIAAAMRGSSALSRFGPSRGSFQLPRQGE
jgi:AcrR family transcriptional regulator